MSNQQWQPPSRAPGAGPGGSVRRARERMEAGLPPDVPPPPRERLYEPPRMAAPNPPANRRGPPVPFAPPAPQRGQAPIGIAISRPSPAPAPQWPLAGTAEPGQPYQPPAGRGPPPQRPPRPSQVPSILGISQLQDASPTSLYTPVSQNQVDYQNDRGRREEEDLISPMVVSPGTMSSRPSTISSVGSIPDFPVPVGPNGMPRRSANLGPPPTSRRGASSYYSQASFVSPIPEESPRTQTTHLSYASSAAIPTSWGSDSPRYPYDEDDYEDDIYSPGRGFDQSPTMEEGRDSRGSADDNDDRGLIRSASFGRRAKPSMITTRSSEKMESRPAPLPQQKPIQLTKLERMGIVAMPANVQESNTPASEGLERKESQRNTVWPIIGDVNSPLATGTGLIDKSGSSSEERLPTVATAVTTNDGTSVSPAERSDLKADAMLGAYNAASSLQAPAPIPTRTPSPGNGFSRLSAVRRPPRLDMDAVRDAEARGSLTSLPDLIRRATRLAAMMDRGKRPGSRMALNDFPSPSDLAREKEMGMSSEDRHKSGLSGMLNAFPPPGMQTPRDGTPDRPTSTWPTGFNDSANRTEKQNQKQRRRCCGLPYWGFFLVLLILLIIIAAAVVVPLELLVLNKPQASTTTLSAVEQCAANTSTACQNGGTSLLDDGSCACICTNGFTGSTCTSADATGCATVTLSGSNFTNVTLGDSISRLISGAQTNYSIPLSESTILARFNSANLSCATENALVTFQGASERRGLGSDLVDPSATIPSLASAIAVQNGRRQAASSTASATGAVATQNGIVYDSSTPTSSSSSASGTATVSDNPQGVFNITEEVLDFARVAVLYVLQEDALENAITAQTSLQTFFRLQSYTNLAASNISLGNGNILNLLTYQVNVGEGPIGAKNTSLSSKRDLERHRRRTSRSGNLLDIL